MEIEQLILFSLVQVYFQIILTMKKVVSVGLGAVADSLMFFVRIHHISSKSGITIPKIKQ